MAAVVAGFVFGMAAAGGVELLEGPDVVSISTSDGRGADATVIRGEEKTSTNYGNEPILAVKSVSYAVKKTYLRFDLENLQGKREVEEAQLVFTTHGNHSKQQVVEVFGLVDGHEGKDWSEGFGGQVASPEEGITYENAPGNAPGVGGGPGSTPEFAGGVVASETLRLGSFEVTRSNGISGETVVFSSPELADFIKSNTSGTITLILTAQNTQNSQDVGFASKEAGTHPGPELRIKTSK